MSVAPLAAILLILIVTLSPQDMHVPRENSTEYKRRTSSVVIVVCFSISVEVTSAVPPLDRVECDSCKLKAVPMSSPPYGVAKSFTDMFDASSQSQGI